MPRDPRPFLVLDLDLGMPRHPAVEDLSDRAFRLLIELWCLTARQSNLGEVTETQARRRGRRARQELEAAGLLMPNTRGWYLPLAGLRKKHAASGRRRGPISEDVRRAVYARDGNACVTCGATEQLSLDHVWPWSLGGDDTESNLQTLCVPCNLRKGAKVE